MAGHCDQKLRMINTLSWKEVFAFDHSLLELNDNNSNPELNIYVESETTDEGPLYEAVGKPFQISRLTAPEMRQIQADGLPRVGISKMAISHDSNFVATVCEQCPKFVWIWDLNTISLNSLLMQKNSVNDITWAPTTLNLNISSNDGKIFLWSLRGASVCQVPQISQKENFRVTKIQWNPNGKNFAAIEHNSGLVFVYP